jgi:hypothetical protein
MILDRADARGGQRPETQLKDNVNLAYDLGTGGRIVK